MADASYLLFLNAGRSSLKAFARRPWRSGLRAGIDDCYWLSKPFDGDALVALVTASLRPGGESTCV